MAKVEIDLIDVEIRGRASVAGIETGRGQSRLFLVQSRYEMVMLVRVMSYCLLLISTTLRLRCLYAPSSQSMNYSLFVVVPLDLPQRAAAGCAA